MKILQQGKVIVLDDYERIQTILGSCVAVCIRDPFLKVCGMNHFALPVTSGDVDMPERYGVHAMEYLLNDLYKLGAEKERLEVIYAGGANLKDCQFRIGWQNIGFIEDFCQTENLKVVGRDVGGIRGRRVVYDPFTGSINSKSIVIAGEDLIVDSNRIKSVEMF